MSPPVDEPAILDALRLVPAERWGEVLDYLHALSEPVTPIRTAADLARSGLVGLWVDRKDLGDSREFARRLRREAEAGTR
jgi:hypothetical protein